MQEMIVLGEIPGTSTQLSFTAWAFTSVAILLFVLFLLLLPDIRQVIDAHLANSRAKKALELLIHYHTI